MPDPDVIVRTAGEFRLSNFLLWEAAYAELVFLDLSWPDFREHDFDEVLGTYARRKRTFGAVRVNPSTATGSQEDRPGGGFGRTAAAGPHPGASGENARGATRASSRSEVAPALALSRTSAVRQFIQLPAGGEVTISPDRLTRALSAKFRQGRPVPRTASVTCVCLAFSLFASPAMADNPLRTDSTDPVQAGCASDAETIAVASLTSDADGSVSPDDVEVRYSPACDSYWGRAKLTPWGGAAEYRVSIQQQQIPLGQDLDSHGVPMDTIYSPSQSQEWTSDTADEIYSDMISATVPNAGGARDVRLGVCRGRR